MNRDGTYDVRYDDGDEERRVESRMIRKLGGSSSPTKRTNKDSDAEVGSGAADGLVAGAKVEAKFGGRGKFYPGTIEATNPDGTFAILFDDGDKEPKALREHVKLVGAPSTPAPAAAPATPAAAPASSGGATALAAGAKGEAKLGGRGSF